MEGYPSELLVGVAPLVFCVDTTKSVAEIETENDADGNETAITDAGSDAAIDGHSIAHSGQTDNSGANDFDNPSQAPSIQPQTLSQCMSLSSRSQFDRLIDALAAASMEDRGSQELPPPSNVHHRRDGSAESRARRKPEEVMRSLFRGEDESGDDTDLDDDVVLNSSTISTSGLPPSGFDSNGDPVYEHSAPRMPTMATPLRRSFRGAPTLGRGFRLGGRNARNSTSPAPSNRSSTPDPLNNATFAATLGEGQHFFQQARLVPISTRHGFPPSKDPDGTKNRINYFVEEAGVPINPRKLTNAMAENPVDGILPSGWFVKHTHALPSLLMVVVPVSMQLVGGDVDLEDPESPPSVDTSAQDEQDQFLLQTLENLHVGLAAKRKCRIFVVGIVQDGTSPIQADQWSQTMSNRFSSEGYEGIQITLLNAQDISDPDQSPSSALLQVHTCIRDASLNYYMAQTRRVKRKLAQLGDSRNTSLVLPLTIRYFFKIAVWYEFQWRHEKSIRYMVEAYRFAERYYRYLVQYKSGELLTDEHFRMTNDPIQHRASINSPGEGFELSFAGSGYTSSDPIIRPPPPSEDMLYQCREMANWLNFKILNACFASRTDNGLWAGSSQWQRHAQAFCSRRRFLVSSIFSVAAEAEKNLNDIYDGESKSMQTSAFENAAWYDWSFVARQRLVVSQLLERHPPCTTQGATDELMMRCSPWRNYEATADALLRLGTEVQRAIKKQEKTLRDVAAKSGDADTEAKTDKKAKDSLRAPYLGSLDSDDIVANLQEESKNKHKEMALDCILRAVSLYEHELEKAKTKPGYLDGTWDRYGARMYYIAGGILLGMGRHKEATPHLEKAVLHSKGWNHLELAIRRMLIECYGTHVPAETAPGPNDSSQYIASMILDSYFNAEMSNVNLRRALENLSGVGAIKWNRSCIDEADSSLPFSFALTFPTSTHATAGDTVKANVLIKSNLDYAVHVNSVTLLSMAGNIDIPPNDMLSARNANVGTDGGIIIQANAEIWVTTHLDLPKDLNVIAIDESGNGGQTQGIAGKGAFAKSARPRSAGITSGGA